MQVGYCSVDWAYEGSNGAVYEELDRYTLYKDWEIIPMKGGRL